MATHHRNVSSEWHALARHPMILNALKTAGVEDPEELAEEEGFQQTLFWLTGPRTVLGLSTMDGRGPLSLLDAADEDEALSRLRLSGASYVGWKRRPMEWLWRIRYVPGLGPLHVTGNGTRYLVFKHAKVLKRTGMVLSLDIVTHSTTKYMDGHACQTGGVVVDSGNFDWDAHADKFPKDHALAEKYMPNGTCGVIAFAVKGTREDVGAFIDRLKFVSIETHVADSRTCVLHPASHTHRQLSSEQLKEAGVPEGLIRLSCGIEAAEDIIADLEQAFAGK